MHSTDKDILHKYVTKELKREAADLEEPADHDAGETTHDMRKVRIYCSDEIIGVINNGFHYSYFGHSTI